MPALNNIAPPFAITQYQYSFFGSSNQVPKKKKSRLIMSADFNQETNVLTCQTVSDNWWGRLRWNLLSNRKSIDTAVQKAFEHYYQADIAILSDWSKEKLRTRTFTRTLVPKKINLLEDHKQNVITTGNESILSHLHADYKEATDQAEYLLNLNTTTATKEFMIPLSSHEFPLSHELSKDDLEKAVALFRKAVAIAEHAKKKFREYSDSWNVWNTRFETAQKKLKAAINKRTSLLAQEELRSVASKTPTPYLNNLLYGTPLPQSNDVTSGV